MRNQFSAGGAPPRPIESAWARCEARSATPPYGTTGEKAASSANGVHRPAPADADDNDLIRVVNLVDHAIAAGPHAPVPFPLAPHGARSRVPWVLDELAKLAAGDDLDGVRQGVELVDRASSTMKRRNERRLSASPTSS
jgi:hypothetical protein